MFVTLRSVVIAVVKQCALDYSFGVWIEKKTSLVILENIFNKVPEFCCLCF